MSHRAPLRPEVCRLGQTRTLSLSTPGAEEVDLGVENRAGWGWELKNLQLSSAWAVSSPEVSCAVNAARAVKRSCTHRPGGVLQARLHLHLSTWMQLTRTNSVFEGLLDWAEVFTWCFMPSDVYSGSACSKSYSKSENNLSLTPWSARAITACCVDNTSTLFPFPLNSPKSILSPHSQSLPGALPCFPQLSVPLSRHTCPVCWQGFDPARGMLRECSALHAPAESLCFWFPEIPLVLYLFALISITWLWGGLHMAYRQLWMLVFFIIFNSLQVRADFWSFGPLGGSPPPLLNARGISAWPAEQNPETNSGLRVTHWRC